MICLIAFFLGVAFGRWGEREWQKRRNANGPANPITPDEALAELVKEGQEWGDYDSRN